MLDSRQKTSGMTKRGRYGTNKYLPWIIYPFHPLYPCQFVFAFASALLFLAACSLGLEAKALCI